MSRSMFTFLGSLIWLATVLLSAALSAQGTAGSPGSGGSDPAERPPLFDADGHGEAVTPDLVDAGLQIALGGSSAGGFGMTCVACHGRDGQGSGRSGVPRIAGQPAGYLFKQLTDYAAGKRANRIMGGVAERLSEYEMQAVSAYYGALAVEYDSVPDDVDPAVLQRGGQLAAVGAADRGITACVLCHLPEASGNGPAVPYLAGQHAGYMAEQLRLWQGGRRANDPLGVMSRIAQQMTEDEIAAVSAYFARLRPQERNGGRDIDIEVEFP